jgi:hypothetical protein
LTKKPKGCIVDVYSIKIKRKKNKMPLNPQEGSEPRIVSDADATKSYVEKLRQMTAPTSKLDDETQAAALTLLDTILESASSRVKGEQADILRVSASDIEAAMQTFSEAEVEDKLTADVVGSKMGIHAAKSAVELAGSVRAIHEYYYLRFFGQDEKTQADS